MSMDDPHRPLVSARTSSRKQAAKRGMLHRPLVGRCGSSIHQGDASVPSPTSTPLPPLRVCHSLPLKIPTHVNPSLAPCWCRLCVTSSLREARAGQRHAAFLGDCQSYYLIQPIGSLKAPAPELSMSASAVYQATSAHAIASQPPMIRSTPFAPASSPIVRNR